jgi:hypothetical protein
MGTAKGIQRSLNRHTIVSSSQRHWPHDSKVSREADVIKYGYQSFLKSQ